MYESFLDGSGLHQMLFLVQGSRNRLLKTLWLKLYEESLMMTDAAVLPLRYLSANRLYQG